MALSLKLGNRIAPPRFIAFALLTAIGSLVAIPRLGWAQGSMTGFDAAALIFLVSIAPLFNDVADEMRQSAKKNDANRAGLLVITGIVMGVVLASVASELMQDGRPKPMEITLIVGTLSLAWIFSNVVYALHYAHLFYTGAHGGKDQGGIEFPKTAEPDYWDFLYFATCLGMTFQVSDMNITSGRVRRVVMFHCLAAFVFNLGIIAFTINVLGGS
jgi:uncharacterized membrane protein